MEIKDDSSKNGSGILEQLEHQVKLKINTIKGLLDLRSDKPNEKYKEVFEEVFRVFSEVNDLVDTLTAKVENEKLFVKYISHILASNELQLGNLKKLSEIINDTEIHPESFKQDVPSEIPNQKNTLGNSSKKVYSNKNLVPRPMKTIKPPIFKNKNEKETRYGVFKRV
ncbi:hypothetical protein TpMuguga_02g00147 [Theileria parva strain Muguga]|uniref:Uncharacterized protein n=1 Tax=Theileria parva TaxID=5875 RepID=Q4N5Z0_THEPA|nr:uncharacterized protein TpMuguga_02g00147 [Theileria parva strain Muguga]EAN32433.1 hypothetical protein TpMuguga_02g00147 [Theileria parva strain Muguga]|eukprot:XP_764716.1 hypothetical protein [Theileria parva strain Muguga]